MPPRKRTRLFRGEPIAGDPKLAAAYRRAGGDLTQLEMHTARAIDQLESITGCCVIEYRKAADALAGTVTGETFFWQNALAYDKRIEAVTYVGNVSLAVDAANYAIVKLYARAGKDPNETATTVAEFRTGVVVAMPYVVKSFALLKRVIPAGGIVTFDIQKFGAGVVVPASLISLSLSDA